MLFGSRTYFMINWFFHVIENVGGGGVVVASSEIRTMFQFILGLYNRRFSYITYRMLSLSNESIDLFLSINSFLIFYFLKQ